jgi:WD40 repeat protein
MVWLDSDSSSEENDDLSVYLDCEEIDEDDSFEATIDRKVPGTCEWITRRPNFVSWIQERALHFWLYWLHAPPGTGKSVVSAHVIDHLVSQGKEVVFFFFSDGDKYHRTVAGLLRCIAFRLAERHTQVRIAIKEMQKDNIHLAELDEVAIWKKLFINCIFKIGLKRTQFWVIDALDECADALKFFPLLHRLKSTHRAFALRIFITSRPPSGPLIELQNQARRASALGLKCSEDRITNEDTEVDIRLLLRENKESIPTSNGKEQEEVLDKIVQKAQGSFLWANIVLRELRGAYSDEEIEQILEDVPVDMVPHYEGILAHMSQEEPRKKPLIQAILTWVVCGNRPLSDIELEMALKLDLRLKIAGTMRRTIEGLCGQILTMDKKGLIRIIHATARDFLLDEENEAEYRIGRRDGHLRLAKTCLEYLSGEEMKPRRSMTVMTPGRRQSLVDRLSAFADYASTAFTYHLVNSHSDDDELFRLVHKFFEGPNVLSWIEYVASKYHSLEHIREAGSNIRRYMYRRSMHFPPIGPGYDTVTGWSADLLRIVSKYGRDIIDSPSHLIRLVPPMCPQASQIYKQFARKNPNFYVVGVAEQNWADAISYIEHEYSDDHAWSRCIATGPLYFAIGEQNKRGLVRLFTVENCEEKASLWHGERVLCLAFNNAGKDLITSGDTCIKYWDLTNVSSPTELWSRAVKQPCLDFFFADDDERLIAATADRRLLNVALDLEEEDGIASFIPGQLKLPDGLRGPGKDVTITAKSQVNFSADGTIIAFICLNRTVAIWSIEDGHFIGICEPEDPAGDINYVLLNPNTDIRLLAMSYGGSSLTLFDYEYYVETRTVSADCVAMASTVDGQTLATADSLGDIDLWDFVTLKKLYRINYKSSVVRDLVFSMDGLRLADTRETHSVVWEPAALIRTNEESDNVSVGASSTENQRMIDEIDNHEDPTEITALACCGDSNHALVGKENGTVSIYNLENGKSESTAFTLNANKAILQLAYHQNGLIAAADSAGMVAVVSCNVPIGDILKLQNTLTTINNSGLSIEQVLFSANGERLLISRSDEIQIWGIRAQSDGIETTQVTNLRAPQIENWWFISCPRDDVDSFWIIDEGLMNFLPHEHWAVRDRLGRSNFDPSQSRNYQIQTVTADQETGYLIIEYGNGKGKSHLIVIERIASSDSNTGTGSLCEPFRVSLGNHRVLLHLSFHYVKAFLGVNKGRLVYLASHLWIRSIDLRSITSYTSGHDVEKDKHFFIPQEYIGGNHRVQARLGGQGQVIFPRRGELAVVWGGLSTC